ncbi:hypothetical protein AB0451_34100 [Streptomyces sp. NPDC052000]|uniref:hypothetical protein n=1 Tax=Streptomyces sp. NPDC052000 TaxID=3155676 RepID=UPI00344CE2DE
MMHVRSIVTALLLAGAAVIPLSSPSTATPHPAPFDSCQREGAMSLGEQGFYTCAQGRYIPRDCTPGARPVQLARDTVMCTDE